MSENIYKHSCNLYICALHSGRCEIVNTSPRLIKKKTKDKKRDIPYIHHTV